MKNTRLYFDKDMKPISKIALELHLPGATPNFETDMDVIVKANQLGTDNSITWIGTTRIVCETQAGHAFDDILTTPSILQDQNNSTESSYDVFLKNEQDSTLASLEPLDDIPNSKYTELLASGDIQYKLQSVDSLDITDCVGNPVVLDSYDISNFLNLPVDTSADSTLQNSYIYFETSLTKILGNKYNQSLDKWFKIKLTYTAGIELTEKAKEYFQTNENSELKQRTATYYLVNNNVFQDLLLTPNILGHCNLAQNPSEFPVVSYRSFNNDGNTYGICADSYSYTEFNTTLDDILATPSIVDTLSIPDGSNTLMSGSDNRGDYIFGGIIQNPIPPVDVVDQHVDIRELFNTAVLNNDYEVLASITTVTAEDSEGSEVTLDNTAFIVLTTKYDTDNLNVSTYPFTLRFYYKDPAIHYPSNFKWVVFNFILNVSVNSKKTYKYKDLFDFSKVNMTTPYQVFKIYVVNPDYQAPTPRPIEGIFINVNGDSGTYAGENLDYITAVGKASLTKQADSTWTLEFSYNLSSGGLTMEGVSNTISNIPDSSVVVNNPIYTDTILSTAPVPFIIKSRT